METASHILLTLLLNSAWQIAAIFAVACLCSLLLRRAAAKYRHPLWIAALVLSVLLPASSLRHLARTQSRSGLALQNVETPFRVSVSGSGGQARSTFQVPHLAPVPVTPAIAWTVAACYFAFLLYRIGCIGLAWRHTRFLRGAARNPVKASRLHGIVERCSSAFGLRRTPAVFLTDSVGPVTVGAFRPILLMPAAFSEAASEPELVSAIGHELAHIRRHDFGFNLACELISLPVSFHPAVMLMKSRIEHTRELACDDMAAEKLTGRGVYAQSLLRIAASLLCPTSPLPSYGQGLFDTRKMEERIMNLIGKSSFIGTGWGRMIALISLAILALASLGASAFSLQVAQPAAPLAVAASTQDSTATTDHPLPARRTAQFTPAPDSKRTISIRELAVVGGDEVPDAQSLLSNELKARLYDTETVGAEVGERARMLYQEHGYFKVLITQPAVTPAGGNMVDITIHVTPGAQYRLSEVQFRGNNVFTQQELRALYPIEPGEVFRPSAIRTGLEAMRRLCQSKGYSKAIPIPDTAIDDLNKTILLTIVIDEGTTPSAASPSAAVQSSADEDIPGYAKLGPGMTPPKPTSTPDPSYDEASKALGVQGTAVFRVAIGADGRVEVLRLKKSGGLPPALIQNAENALRQWTFEPARKDGAAVSSQMSVEINFRLY